MLRLRTLFAIAVAVGALSIVATGCGDDGDEPAPGVGGGQQASAETSDPLVGEWDSGPVPISKIKASVAAADPDADVDQLLRYVGLGGAKSLEFNREFYREGDEPFVIDRGWDPTAGPKPADGDHGPYELLPEHRIAITSADPDIHAYRAEFSYSVKGDRLTLRVVDLTDPSVRAQQLRLDKQFLFVQTAVPLKRVGN